ncbi:MAG TPA: phosphoglucosamine mutase [Bacilli bacterium]|nr:phosphoglucosamine mutase [Bacilli bacterium]
MGKYFGTDGVRGPANDVLDSNLAYRIGRYLGSLTRNGRGPKILISRDTRLSGQMLLAGLTSGILTSGGHVYDIGISTTPSVSYLVKTKGYDFGIMISASHNPFYDNGIKVFSRDGTKISEEIEDKIEEYIDSVKDHLPLAKNNKVGRSFYVPELVEEYINFIVATKEHDCQLRLLVDSANGSASNIAPRVFAHTNFNIDYIGDEPNGININLKCGSTHLDLLKQGMATGSYDLGIAFDGDADRVLLVDKDGREINGDFILYLLAKSLKAQGKLAKDTVVITVMSNLGLIRALEKEEIACKIVDVGDKYIQAEILEHGYSLGGEQSGHIIIGHILNTGDGVLSALQILNILAEHESVEEAFSGFKKFPQKLTNVTVDNKDAVIEHEGLKDLIEKQTKLLNGNGRILVRKSGTEPYVRVMVEAQDLELCEKTCDLLVKYIMSLGF